MHDEMTNSDFICVLAEKAHPTQNPSAEHADIMDEAARRIRKLERERDEAHRISEIQLESIKFHMERAQTLERECDNALEDAKTADEHRRLAERLAEAAMFERNQLRMRVAELENGIVVEGTK